MRPSEMRMRSSRLEKMAAAHDGRHAGRQESVKLNASNYMRLVQVQDTASLQLQGMTSLTTLCGRLSRHHQGT